MTHNIPVNAPYVLVSEADLTMLLMKSKRVDELEESLKTAQKDAVYDRTMYHVVYRKAEHFQKELQARENVAITLRSLLSDSQKEASVLRQSMKDIGEALKRSGGSLTALLTEPAVAP